MDINHIAFWRKNKVKTDSNVTNSVKNCNCGCNSFEKVLEVQKEISAQNTVNTDKTEVINEPLITKYAVPVFFKDGYSYYDGKYYDPNGNVISETNALKYAVPYFPETDNNNVNSKPETHVRKYSIPDDPDRFMLKYAVPKLLDSETDVKIHSDKDIPVPLYAIPNPDIEE